MLSLSFTHVACIHTGPPTPPEVANMRKRAAERKQRRAALKQRYAEAQLQVCSLVSLPPPLSWCCCRQVLGGYTYICLGCVVWRRRRKRLERKK